MQTTMWIVIGIVYILTFMKRMERESVPKVTLSKYETAMFIINRCIKIIKI
jgi:hypothetical protein